MWAGGGCEARHEELPSSKILCHSGKISFLLFLAKMRFYPESDLVFSPTQNKSDSAQTRILQRAKSAFCGMTKLLIGDKHDE
jgi:hypothetical protein